MGRPLTAIAGGIAMVVALAGCQLLPSGTATTTSQCTPDNVHQVVDRFIEAFNRGDVAQLDQLFARDGEGFHWYSTDAPGQRLNAEASNRDSLMAYFAARHLQHERLALNSLDITYTNGLDAGFWFRLTRSADDGLPPTRYNGKGGVQCMFTPSSLTTWAMDPHPWSPIELLPEAAALILLALTTGVFVLSGRRRKARRTASPAVPRE